MEKECFKCKEKGHFHKVKICQKRKKKAAVGRVNGGQSEMDSEDTLPMVVETVKVDRVRNIKGPANGQGEDVQTWEAGS